MKSNLIDIYARQTQLLGKLTFAAFLAHHNYDEREKVIDSDCRFMAAIGDNWFDSHPFPNWY